MLVVPDTFPFCLPVLTQHCLRRRRTQASPSTAAPAIRCLRASPLTQATRRLRAARRCPTISTLQPPRRPTAAAMRLREPTSSSPRPRCLRSSRALLAMRSRLKTPNMPCLRLCLSPLSLLLLHPLHLSPTRCARYLGMCVHFPSRSYTWASHSAGVGTAKDDNVSAGHLTALRWKHLQSGT